MADFGRFAPIASGTRLAQGTGMMMNRSSLPYASTLASMPSVEDSLPSEIVQELAPRYRLEALIGEGGFGVVYRARHAVLGRPVALKLLRADIGSDKALVERFRREAQSAARIDSPHVVRVLDFGHLKSGEGYIVMELLEGRSLALELEISGAFSVSRAVRITRQLCDALSAAHGIGIVHRDLKPENVLLDTVDGENDIAKVVDFGLAKIHGMAAITAAGRAIGTPQYMAPEQCAGCIVDARSDIYSLGIVLYQMLTDRLPFEQTGLHAIFSAHVRDTPPSPRMYRPDLSPELEAIVLRCLAKDPADRYQSMAALGRALEEAVRPAPAPVVARPVPVIAPAAAPIVAPRRSRSFPLALVAALALIFGAAIGTLAASLDHFARSHHPATPAQHALQLHHSVQG